MKSAYLLIPHRWIHLSCIDILIFYKRYAIHLHSDIYRTNILSLTDYMHVVLVIIPRTFN